MKGALHMNDDPTEHNTEHNGDEHGLCRVSLLELFLAVAIVGIIGITTVSFWPDCRRLISKVGSVRSPEPVHRHFAGKGESLVLGVAEPSAEADGVSCGKKLSSPGLESEQGNDPSLPEEAVSQQSSSTQQYKVVLQSASDYASIELLADGPDSGQEATVTGPGNSAAAKEEQKELKKTSAIDVLKAAIAAAGASRRKLRQVLQQMDGYDIEEAIVLVEEMEWGPEASKVLQELMVRWGQLDADSALQYAQELPGRRAQNSAIGSALNGWAGGDPQAAFAWFCTKAEVEPASCVSGVDPLFQNMANHDVEWAFSKVWDLPQTGMKIRALRAVLNKMQVTEPADMTDLYNMVTRQSDKALVAAALVQNVAVYQPEIAASWIDGLADTDVRNNAINRLVSAWGYDQPEEAADWILNLPYTDIRGKQMGRLIATWSRVDPSEASEWLDQFPPSKELDPAVRALVRATMKENPVGAMTWVQSITNSRQRRRLTQQVGWHWIKKDRESAQFYIARSDLSEVVKKRLLSR